MSKYLIFALVFALLNMGAIFAIFGVQKYSDSSEYIEIINWFQGQEWQTAPYHRLLKPLGPFIAIPFEFLGEGAGLIVENIFFYLLSAFLIFKIVELIYQNKKQALLASIFFITATPILEVGLSYLVDMGSWFFYLLSIFLTLLYFKGPFNDKLIILNGFISGLGLLMKEHGGLGALFFGLMILFAGGFSAKEKMLKIIYFGAFLLIPFLAVQILVFQYYHFTYLDWFLGGMVGIDKEGLLLVSLRYLGQVFRILGILWLFILIGAWRELQERNWQRIKIFFALLPSSFSFLLWTVGGGGRAAFIFAPLGILLASYGCRKIRLGYLIIFISLLLIVNYTFVWFNKSISFTDLLYQFGVHILAK